MESGPGVSSRVVGRGVGGGGGLRVLLVDDEPHITDVCGRALERVGFSVEVASSVASALATAREGLPDLVVSDVEMPGGTGIDLADGLLGIDGGGRVPVVLLTGRGHLVEADASERMNVRGVMHKPFSARDLVERVSLLLGVRSEGEAA